MINNSELNELLNIIKVHNELNETYNSLKNEMKELIEKSKDYENRLTKIRDDEKKLLDTLTQKYNISESEVIKIVKGKLQNIKK